MINESVHWIHQSLIGFSFSTTFELSFENWESMVIVERKKNPYYNHRTDPWKKTNQEKAMYTNFRFGLVPKPITVIIIILNRMVH
ncbi:hypothetical protein DERF_013845 [Dermatophagoides farinae]|uniref:Uncharacterized protein n=1 Tax=Dermatophagoides farinae TaxID=6954 RepID=A0A922HNA3_DERFA|nr:hypothetical protein DERF_013845 [Dermatophagoides farinae]